MEKRVILKDTTFRDGTQGEGISADNLKEVLRAISAIDALGIRYHEVGFAVASQLIRDRIKAACELPLVGKVAAFGRTHPKDVEAFLELPAPVAVVVGKTRMSDVSNVLRKSGYENLDLIRQSIEALVAGGKEVIYDAEHCFDGFLHDNAGYAMETLRVAAAAGAHWIVLCDTNGASTSARISEVVTRVTAALPSGTLLGVHTHNDRGRAIANAEAAWVSGVKLVEGTIGGIGERVGNMDLLTFMANVVLDGNAFDINADQLGGMTRLYHLVCDVLNMTPRHDAPYVGRSAFYTEAGMHAQGNERATGNYEHCDPAVVGNQRRVGITDQSGKTNIEVKARELGIDLSDAQVTELAQQYQKLVDVGCDFGLADASFHLFILKHLGRVPEFGAFREFRLLIEKEKDRPVKTQASLRLHVHERDRLQIADGDGPVNALDEVLRRTIKRSYPQLLDVRLTDFKVRTINPTRGTAAAVRVRINFTDGKKEWTTMAVYENIIEAAWDALWHGYVYKLVLNGK